MAFKALTPTRRPYAIRRRKVVAVPVSKPAPLPPKPAQPYSGIYPSYLFREHDPVLDQIDTLIADANLTINQVSVASRVSETTLLNWQKRKTKRPQFATIAAVVRSIGGDIQIIYADKVIQRRSDT